MYKYSTDTLYTVIQKACEDHLVLEHGCLQHYTTDTPDDGDVHTGTLCPKVCVNFSRMDHSVPNYDCEPLQMCHGRRSLQQFKPLPL